jgi:cytochrome c oxidase subunit 2
MLALVAALGTGLIGTGEFARAQADAPVIKIVAKKFDYTPSVIRLKKGVPVVLEFTTLDVFMGFKVPTLGVRADIIPGKLTRLNLVPDKIGTFPFLCDIFCGTGHEDMTGSLVVTE